MDHSNLRNDELVASIGVDVLAVLNDRHFFENLDDHFCPVVPQEIRAQCDHSFRVSTQILERFGMDTDAIEDVLAVLQSRGACCDCEVLYNVADESRLKAEKWKSEFEKVAGHPRHR